MSERPYMDTTEFREHGYLQELNRHFLHPLGLALEVAIDLDHRGGDRIIGVSDHRDLPEGIRYSRLALDPIKAHHIHAERERRRHARYKRYGFIIQPLERR